jgi:LuxR family maltose regulon positive regulatory protein
VRIWLAQVPAKLAAATRWAEGYGQDWSPHGRYQDELAQRTLARVALARGRPASALDHLARLQEAAAATGRGDSLIRIEVLQALAWAAQGETGRSVGALDRALTLAAPEGYRRVFLDEGEPLVALLRQSQHPYATQLAEEVNVRTNTPISAPAPSAGLEEALNAREIQVLRHFSAGLTNAEVAQEMFLSVNTIKWYAKKIYRKLNVHRRAQAVARARDLGLLP